MMGDLAAAGLDAVLLSTEPFPFQEKHIAEVSRHTGLALRGGSKSGGFFPGQPMDRGAFGDFGVKLAW